MFVLKSVTKATSDWDPLVGSPLVLEPLGGTEKALVVPGAAGAVESRRGGTQLSAP